MQPTPKLLQGPYGAPFCRPGDWLDDVVEGRLEVGGFTTAPIPWPRRKKTGRAALILCGDLVRAVSTESVEAVCYWWGVGATKVWMWRQALGIGRITDGTRLLLQDRTGVPPEASALGRERAKSAVSRAKMASTKRGQPMHPRTRSALALAAQAPKGEAWGARANAWMLGRTLPSQTNGVLSVKASDMTSNPIPTKAGGARAGAGRPTQTGDGGPMVRKTITLDTVTIDILTQLGDGLLSEGIRRAARKVAAEHKSEI